MTPVDRVTPRTFYLNEQHELARGEKAGGGSIPKYTDVNWAAKGSTISRSLHRVQAQIEELPDPAKESHYFLLAAPVPQLAKESSDRTKAVGGRIFERTNFAEKHSRIFRRLGLDLINVSEDGAAVVHMKPELVEQLSNTAATLSDLGPREKSRWATIERFGLIPTRLRIDSDWVTDLQPRTLADSVVEFQPLLTRSEIDSVLRTLVSLLLRNRGEAITGMGSDFSGRHWVRGRITRESLTRIAEGFLSVQSLHSPLISLAARTTGSRSTANASTSPTAEEISALPVIGVIDTGVPGNHSILSRYRRGTYLSPTTTANPADPHGCFVASRIVFGDPDFGAGPPARTPGGSARFYDINVSGIQAGEIEDKGVSPAFQALIATAPDVRVFNMSFDSATPLELMSEVKRSESLLLVQDLDNFIFQNDVLVVTAAGNSPVGLAPATAYPGHFNQPDWALGHWARSFNSLTCGSLVGRLSPGGLVNQLGWPSPFCRVGPGLSDSPKPDFSANGGNSTPQYGYAAGLGVWGLSPTGMWEDHPGTSFAAPLLARECAFALSRLQAVCERGAQPFAVTAKALLALTASPPVRDEAVRELSERTLGRGVASARRLESPSATTGVMIWQGVLQDDSDIARIQIPIPADWIAEADEPHFRLIVAWDPPVNAAVRQLWSTRDVTAKLRLHPEAPAQRTLRVKSHGTYPF